MARLYSRSLKGRKVLLSSPTRTTRSRHTNNSPSTSGKTHPAPSTSTILAPARAPTKQRSKTSTKNHDESYGLEGDGDSDSAEDADDDDDDDDEEDEEEEPEYYAPSHAKKMHQTGRKISPMEYEQRLFGSSDDEDDDVYEAVNDISDSDDDIGEKHEEAYFESLINKSKASAVFESETEEDPASILDNIDGMSFLGFDGDVDLEGLEEPLSFSDDSDSHMDVAYETVVERHVHFPSDIDQPGRLTASISPLLTRALLPSALPKDAAGRTEPRPPNFRSIGAQATTSQRYWLDDDDSMWLMAVVHVCC